MIKNQISLVKKGSYIGSKLLLIFLLAMQVSVFGQGRQITGTVSDQNGETIPGVNVIVKGTTIGTISSIDGNYSISVSDGAKELLFSFVGYIDQTVAINGQSKIDVTLEEDVFQLNEVVAIGYGVQKKKLNTGSSVNIGGDEIQKLNTTNPMEALKGISAGLNITQSNGQPGTDARVYIRGVGTIDNAGPLYVVDGVSTSSITHLAASDIESIDVLKDAASAAIYGSRAANGVILVTTKSGKKSKRPTVSYDFYNGWHQAVNMPEMLNASQYIEMMQEGSDNDLAARGKAPKAIDWAKQFPYYQEVLDGTWNGTDWLSEIIDEDAGVQSHSVNITGGSEMSTYSMGFSHLSETGIIGKGTNNGYKRINLRLNSDHVIFNNGNFDVLKVGETLNFTNNSNPTVRTGNIYWSDMHNALVTSPLLPMDAIDPTDKAYPYHYAVGWNSLESNPIANMIYSTKNSTNTGNKILGKFYAELQPLRNLVYRSSFGVDAWFGNSRSYTVPYELSSVALATIDNVTQSMNQGYTWTFTNTLSYNYTAGEHNFTGLLGTESIKNAQSLSMSTSNEGNLFGDWEHAYITNAAVLTTNTTIAGRDDYGWGMFSYFGRLSYDYKETYLFTAVMRADASSNFTDRNRWGYFPSVSGGWVASNESFMENVPNINFLKLRGSWGQNGNQDIKPFQFLSSLSFENSRYFFGTDKTSYSLGAYPAILPNPDVKWETSEQIDLGFDVHFFDSKLQFNFDWYNKTTRDWLVVAPALATYGTDPAYINGGSIVNKGIEAVGRWQDNIGNLNYSVSVSYAHNKNEVTDIQNEEKIIHGENANNVLSQGMAELYRAEVGYPIGYFWGLQTDGIIQNEAEAAAYVGPEGELYFKDSKPGDVRFVDQNADGEIDDLDKVMLGDPNPDHILGFQINLDFKGAYIQLTSNGQFGQQVAMAYHSATGPKSNYTTDIFDLRWHGEGTSDLWPALSQSPNRNTQWVSDLYIHNADFLRISNLTVGYDLKNIFPQMPLGEARVYVSGKNLFTFTKYPGMDPEVGYGPDKWASGIDVGLYPSAKTYLVGISLTF
ncbi:MAG: SusC/RagA family TonB-linked outer membrane protein [Prolixibacteraceae bacterium]